MPVCGGVALSTVQVKWIDAQRFVGVDSSKHSVVMSSQDAENATGVKPSDLLLLALGGCAGIDVVGILQKQRQGLTGFEMTITGEQDADPPWAFRTIAVECVFHGHNLSEQAIQRAIELSENKYCSVAATVSAVAKINYSYRIVEES
jgi:putative redox protein